MFGAIANSLEGGRFLWITRKRYNEVMGENDNYCNIVNGKCTMIVNRNDVRKFIFKFYW